MEQTSRNKHPSSAVRLKKKRNIKEKKKKKKEKSGKRKRKRKRGKSEKFTVCATRSTMTRIIMW